MNFCVISPAAGLQRFARTKSHLVLAQVDNPIYREFYRQRREEGDLLILDNGAYEGKMSEERLLESIVHYKPQVIVLPDILLGDAKESFELSKTFHKTWRSQVDVQWMYVPQSRNDESIKWANFLDKGLDVIQPEWVGLPRALATDVYNDTSHKANIRANYCRYVRESYPNVNVHALGMVAGNLDELEQLREAGCTSIDSSAPVWRGWNGFKIDDYDEWNAQGTECDFDARPLDAFDFRVKLINENLVKCGVGKETL